jgi:hypothetical protein
MKAALIDNQNNVSNVIVWDDTCTAPKGTVVVVVADDVAVAPGWTYANGTFTAPEPEPMPDPETALTTAGDYLLVDISEAAASIAFDGN